jgi:hypothetical protein
MDFRLLGTECTSLWNSTFRVSIVTSRAERSMTHPMDRGTTEDRLPWLTAQDPTVWPTTVAAIPRPNMNAE